MMEWMFYTVRAPGFAALIKFIFCNHICIYYVYTINSRFKWKRTQKWHTKHGAHQNRDGILTVNCKWWRLLKVMNCFHFVQNRIETKTQNRECGSLVYRCSFENELQQCPLPKPLSAMPLISMWMCVYLVFFPLHCLLLLIFKCRFDPVIFAQQTNAWAIIFIAFEYPTCITVCICTNNTSDTLS